jgi:hypothetical protein
MAGKIKKLAEKIANPGDLVKANIYSSPIKNIGKVMQIEIAKKIAGKPKKMKFGGETKPLVGGQKKLDKNKDGKISGDDFAMMEMGGKVEEYGGGGKVKGGKMSCRGMGAAIKGGGFKIR